LDNFAINFRQSAQHECREIVRAEVGRSTPASLRRGVPTEFQPLPPGAAHIRCWPTSERGPTGLAWLIASFIRNGARAGMRTGLYRKSRSKPGHGSGSASGRPGQRVEARHKQFGQLRIFSSAPRDREMVVQNVPMLTPARRPISCERHGPRRRSAKQVRRRARHQL